MYIGLDTISYINTVLLIDTLFILRHSYVGVFSIDIMQCMIYVANILYSLPFYVFHDYSRILRNLSLKEEVGD